MTTRTQAEVVADSVIEAVCANIAADPHVAAGFKNMGESGGVSSPRGYGEGANPTLAVTEDGQGQCTGRLPSSQVARLKTYRVDMDLGGQIDWMDVRATCPERAIWEALELVDEYTRKSAAFITVSVGER